jgi:hypothetical protein
VSERKRYVRLLAPSWFDAGGGRNPDKPPGAEVWLLPAGSTYEVVEPGDAPGEVYIALPPPFFGDIPFWMGDDGELAEFVDEPGPPVEIAAIDERTAAKLFPHFFGSGD